MLERISYRGPDGRGHYVDHSIALGNVLLSIVNIGNGRQPFIRQYDGETYVATYNGEIYNYMSLRDELIGEGFSFSTTCDTEVAAAAFAAWGEDALGRFDGQWSLAIWEVNKRRLTLSRDPLGIKPLFYYSNGTDLAFASEPKALLSLPGVPKRPNIDAIREYFLHGFAFAAGYSLSHRSFYEGIESLAPGHQLVWTVESGVASRRYFDFPTGGSIEPADRAETVTALGAAVRSSTEACLMGDAPVGIALSGGLDSSVIATVAARDWTARGKDPILASCISYSSQALNEDADHARLLAESAPSDAPIHLTYSTMSPDSYLADLDDMIRHFDEPHWEVKQLAMFNNYRALKANGAKVVLTGEGSDELFFGYYHRFPGFQNPVIDSAETLRDLWSRRLPAVGRLLADTPVSALEGLQLDAIDRHYAPYAAAEPDPDRRMQLWYLGTFLHWLLIDNDRCSMAFSLEGRFPFLNRDVFQLALRIPSGMQVGPEYGQEKLLLREAFSRDLPEEIWRKRKKAPLPSPARLTFHRAVACALRTNIEQAAPEVWSVLDRKGVTALSDAYSERIAELEHGGQTEGGGEALTRYLQLNEPWSVRTPHAFGILTLLRWWKLNFADDC